MGFGLCALFLSPYSAWRIGTIAGALLDNPEGKLVRIAGKGASSIWLLLQFFLLVGHATLVSYGPIGAMVSQAQLERQGVKPETATDDLQMMTGDSLVILPTLLAESVQCCVTSPPYWGLRDYDHPAQIGAETSPEFYVQNLVVIFREVRRVLRREGTLWLNVGDGYARNGGTGNCGPNAIVGNTKKLIQKRNCKVPNCWGLKDRDLMGLPWRVAFGLQADGWILRSKITWIKKTAMPESVKNRPTNATEEIFLFAKSPTYYYDPQGVREATGANLRNYWLLGPDPNTNGHPAAFPRELASRCILLGSREGDTILDPFGGCGTTGLAARELNRRSILIELNPIYAKMGRERTLHGKKTRIKAVNPGLFPKESW